MPLFTTLAALSQTPASNPPDGAVDAPSTIDDQLRLLGSFIAQLRDGSGFTTAVVPTGTVIDYAGTSAPTGFLACDGSAVSRTTYAGLFSAIGTTWGAGDGSTTFNVPDLRRRTTIGSGGTQVSGPATAVGSVGGEEAHTLTSGEMPAHNHPVIINDPGHSHTQEGTTLYFFGSGDLASGSAFPANTKTASTASSTTGITATTSNTGSGSAHNVMQPSAVVMKIIKI